MELKNPHDFLVDNHLHTQFAYCAKTVQADTNIEISQLLGLRGITLTEHTFHLYFSNKTAWSMQWLTDLDMVKQAYADPVS